VVKVVEVVEEEELMLDLESSQSFVETVKEMA
jgi:hypothetical protein